MNAMTAAHTTLPIPTWVEVTNLANGKHVVVKVNDRGPFVDNRLIDLSYAAALQLDMVRNGTARVEVRALSSPLGAPPLPTPSPATPQVTTARSRRLRPDSSPRRGRGSRDLVGRRGAAVARLGRGRATRAVRASRRIRRPDQCRAARRAPAPNGFVNAFVVSEADGATHAAPRAARPAARRRASSIRCRRRLRALGFGESQLVVAR